MEIGTRENNINFVFFILKYSEQKMEEAKTYFDKMTQDFINSTFKTSLYYLNVFPQQPILHNTVIYFLDFLPSMRQFIPYGHHLHSKEF